MTCGYEIFLNLALLLTCDKESVLNYLSGFSGKRYTKDCAMKGDDENKENKESLKEYMIKEIELIQDIIKRMAFNSFMIKGWAVTLVVVTLLLKGTEKYQVLLAFIPLLVFWFLDAYFLWQERMYRKL